MGYGQELLDDSAFERDFPNEQLNREGFKVNMIGENCWLFEGSPRSGKSILAALIHKENMEYHDISNIRQFEQIMKNRMRPIKYKNDKIKMDFVFIVQDSGIGNYIKDWFS